MFSFVKMIGSPPKAYKYYRSTKNAKEKEILLDLYKSYKEFSKNTNMKTELSFDFSSRKELIVSLAYKELQKYGEEKRYPEFLISLFRE